MGLANEFRTAAIVYIAIAIAIAATFRIVLDLFV